MKKKKIIKYLCKKIEYFETMFVEDEIGSDEKLVHASRIEAYKDILWFIVVGNINERSNIYDRLLDKAIKAGDNKAKERTVK